MCACVSFGNPLLPISYSPHLGAACKQGAWGSWYLPSQGDSGRKRSPAMETFPFPCSKAEQGKNVAESFRKPWRNVMSSRPLHLYQIWSNTATGSKAERIKCNTWPQALSLLQPPLFPERRKLNFHETQTRREEGVWNGYTSLGRAMSFTDSPLPMLSLVLTGQSKEAVKSVSISWNLACGAAYGGESQCVCREA